MGRFFSLVTAAAVVAFLPFRADAQTRDIAGKVTMAGSSQPLADVWDRNFNRGGSTIRRV